MNSCGHDPSKYAFCPVCDALEGEAELVELKKKLNDARMTIEIHENTIADLNQRIAILES